MRNLRRAWWAVFLLPVLLWLLADRSLFHAASVFEARTPMLQLTGIIAFCCMGVAMVLALRPRWPEQWIGGLDRMYRLHKWLGITALVAAVIHWLWKKGPKWAVEWGLLDRPARGPKPPADNAVEALFRSMHGLAEDVGEWAFYAAVVLIVLALVRRFPYRLFYKTHRLIAVAFLALAFHAAVLLKFEYWTAPIGWLVAAVIACGVFTAGVVLLRRVGAKRQVKGTIASLRYYPGLTVLETEIAVPQGWPGHRAGQFAFVMSDAAEGPHPYTIASAWDDGERKISFVTKALGDHTRRLPERLHVGQEVRIEGPYGCFTFDDDCSCQIWIGAGIGITPFIARLKHLGRERARGHASPQTVHLFHPTADVDDEALARLAADAREAGIRLHVFIDAVDGRLTGERIRLLVPEWRAASIWFCGPAGFGQSLRKDFAAQQFPVDRRFHQELFNLR